MSFVLSDGGWRGVLITRISNFSSLMYTVPSKIARKITALFLFSQRKCAKNAYI